MKIKAITLDKIEDTIDFYRKAYTESAWRGYPFSKLTLRKYLERAIEDISSFTCICISNNEIIGGFLADLGKFPFCETLFGMESGFYVDKEHRGSRAAFLMANEFFKWCDDMNAEPFFEIYYGDDNEKTYNFCRKIGMIECGKIFIGRNHGVRKENIQQSYHADFV